MIAVQWLENLEDVYKSVLNFCFWSELVSSSRLGLKLPGREHLKCQSNDAAAYKLHILLVDRFMDCMQWPWVKPVAVIHFAPYFVPTACIRWGEVSMLGMYERKCYELAFAIAHSIMCIRLTPYSLCGVGWMKESSSSVDHCGYFSAISLRSYTLQVSPRIRP